MKISNTAERLRAYMNKFNLRQVDILEKCKPYSDQYDIKLGRNDLSQYVSGKVEPRQDKISLLAKALNVDEAWLMGYDVPESPALQLSDTELAIILAYRQADDLTKQMVHRVLSIDDSKPEESAV